MEKTHEKEKTRWWPKTAIGGIVIISEIALISYKGYKHHQSHPPAVQQQIRTLIAKHVVRDYEQSRRKLGKWSREDQAYYQVFLERAKNGYGPLDMLWNIREIANQIAERQREQVRKERRKVTNREVHQKACGKLDKSRSVRKRKRPLERP